MKHLEVVTPRGNNIGTNIINHLTNIGLYKNVDIESIVTRRNIKNRTNVTTLSYTFVQ